MNYDDVFIRHAGLKLLMISGSVDNPGVSYDDIVFALMLVRFCCVARTQSSDSIPQADIRTEEVVCDRFIPSAIARYFVCIWLDLSFTA
ncbi:MAG: hypothetical protein PVF13_03975 [Chromatiales bacterium]